MHVGSLQAVALGGQKDHRHVWAGHLLCKGPQGEALTVVSFYFPASSEVCVYVSVCLCVCTFMPILVLEREQPWLLLIRVFFFHFVF